MLADGRVANVVRRRLHDVRIEVLKRAKCTAKLYLKRTRTINSARTLRKRSWVFYVQIYTHVTSISSSVYTHVGNANKAVQVNVEITKGGHRMEISTITQISNEISQLFNRCCRARIWYGFFIPQPLKERYNSWTERSNGFSFNRFYRKARNIAQSGPNNSCVAL